MIYKYSSIYPFINCVHMTSNYMIHMWRSEDIFCRVRLSPSTSYTSSRDWTQLTRYFYSLSHFADPKYYTCLVFFFLFPLNNIYRVFSWSSGVTQCARNAQIKSLEMEEPERADGAIRSQLQKDWQGSWRDGDRPLKKQKNCASCHHEYMQTRKGTCQKFKCYKMYTCGNNSHDPPHTNM